MKILSNHWEDPKAAHLLDEDIWFTLNQNLLVQMANTKFGKDLLCIEDKQLPIVAMGKNYVRYCIRPGKFISDFRIGAKWANTVRCRFSQFQSYSRYFLNDNPVLISPLARYARSVCATVTTVYPDPNVETTTVDGTAEYNNEENFATTRGAATGTSAADSGALNYCGRCEKHSADDFIVDRGFYLFDTSSITDTDTLDSAVLSLYGRDSGTANTDTSDVDIVSTTPASNTAITTADFDQFGSTAFSSIAISSWVTSAYNDFTLDASGIASITTTGVSKFGARNSRDTDNSAPTGDNATLCSMAETATTAQDPKLAVTHSAAAAATTFLLTLGVGT